MLLLTSAAAAATVVPDAGGRLSSLVVGATELVVTGGSGDPPTLWGSFPMAPYAGRVRDGRFSHDDVEHELPLTLPPHAGHGTVFDTPWTVVDGDRSRVALHVELGPQWPLGGYAEQHVVLHDDRLALTLAVVAGDRSMPAELGWHAWFATRGRIELAAEAMYERGDDGLPTGRLVAPPPPPWDDCFVTHRPIRFTVGDVAVEVRSDADHAVVFDQLDIGTAVEPQSGPPDAFHLAPRVLAPGERLERTMVIAWSAERGR
ncbi:MAG: aldose epimerase [Acidimicrobiia bacterium]|nr:aldose epimerase [Acidimicrobiia bacterium]